MLKWLSSSRYVYVCFLCSTTDNLKQHRDPHLANICVIPTHSHNKYDIPVEQSRHMRPKDRRSTNFGYSGLIVEVIDFTFSRSNPKRTNDGSLAGDQDTNGAGVLWHPCNWDLRRSGPQSLSERAHRHTYAYVMQHAQQTKSHIPPISDDSMGFWASYRPPSNVLWLRHLLVALYGHLVWLPDSSRTCIELQEKFILDLKGLIDRLNAELPPSKPQEAAVITSAKGLMERALRLGILLPEDVDAMRALYESQRD